MRSPVASRALRERLECGTGGRQGFEMILWSPGVLWGLQERLPVLLWTLEVVMVGELVRIGDHLVNLAAVASAHWEKDRLFVHLIGGRFLQLGEKDGGLLWRVMSAPATDLGAERPGPEKRQGDSPVL